MSLVRRHKSLSTDVSQYFTGEVSITCESVHATWVKRISIIITLFSWPSTIHPYAIKNLHSTYTQMHQYRFKATTPFQQTLNDDSTITFAVSYSQRQLGDLVGLTRETVNRHMRVWAECGFIKLCDGTLTLLNPEALSRIADGNDLKQ